MPTIQEKKLQKRVHIPDLASPILRPNAWEKQLLKIRSFTHLTIKTLITLGSLRKTIQALRNLKKKSETVNDFPPFLKVAKVSGRYFWRLANPGYPSPAFDRVFFDEVNRVSPYKDSDGLRTLLLGITKKCPLDCEHCFEWKNLNHKETLTAENLIQLVQTYQGYGTGQFMISGGEPMVRIKELYKILEKAKTKESDFWIYSSGFGFTRKHAHALKSKGLTGILLSLDHHEQTKHDQFRGYPGAFEALIHAAIYAKEAGLLVGLSLCARPDYYNSEDIAHYMNLARRLGCVFVRFLEARSTGRYQNKNVALSEEQISCLKDSYNLYNLDPKYWDYPIIDWPDDQQRLGGCFAGGNRFFYIDTDGDAHACPFCANKVCSALDKTAHEVVGELQKKACGRFSKPII